MRGRSHLELTFAPCLFLLFDFETVTWLGCRRKWMSWSTPSLKTSLNLRRISCSPKQTSSDGQSITPAAIDDGHLWPSPHPNPFYFNDVLKQNVIIFHQDVGKAKKNIESCIISAPWNLSKCSHVNCKCLYVKIQFRKINEQSGWTWGIFLKMNREGILDTNTESS